MGPESPRHSRPGSTGRQSKPGLLGSGKSRRGERGSQPVFTGIHEDRGGNPILTWDLQREGLSFSEAEAGMGSRGKGRGSCFNFNPMHCEGRAEVMCDGPAERK